MPDMVEKCYEAFVEYLEEHEQAPEFVILGGNIIQQFSQHLGERFANKASTSREYRLKQYMGCHILCSWEDPDSISFAHNPFAAGGKN